MEKENLEKVNALKRDIDNATKNKELAVKRYNETIASLEAKMRRLTTVFKEGDRVTATGKITRIDDVNSKGNAVVLFDGAKSGAWVERVALDKIEPKTPMKASDCVEFKHDDVYPDYGFVIPQSEKREPGSSDDAMFEAMNDPLFHTRDASKETHLDDLDDIRKKFSVRPIVGFPCVQVNLWHNGRFSLTNMQARALYLNIGEVLGLKPERKRNAET